MDVHSVDPTESREKKKNPAAKYEPKWELNQGPPTFMPYILQSELIPYLLKASDF